MEDPAEETFAARILYILTTSGAEVQPEGVANRSRILQRTSIIRLVPLVVRSKVIWIKSSLGRSGHAQSYWKRVDYDMRWNHAP